MLGQGELESAPGQGSRFIFTARLGLPGAATATPPEAEPPQPAAPLHQPTDLAQPLFAQLQGARVLLVDDNETNRELGYEILSEAGVQVDQACNGEEAIALVMQTPYDAVLMDWQMPVMDGFEATRRIRAEPRFATLPILAMTANAMSGDRARCLAAGMNDHIPKPIDINQLLSTLAHWIQRPAPATPPQSEAPEPAPAAPPDPLPELPGVDMGPALARLRGDVRQYRKLMLRFAQGHAQTTATLASQLQAGAYADAQRLAHTLKGLAANLGAETLRLAAQQLEQALETPMQSPLAALQAQVDHALQPLLDAVQAELTRTNAAPAANAPAVDPSRLAHRLQELAALLARDDANAGPLAEDLAHSLASLPHAQDFATVSGHILRYDFDAALQALQTFARSLGIALEGTPP